MTRRVRSMWLLAAVAPTMLVVVAVTQWYRVSEQQLTPWKGGGFGMFSTVESRGARFVRCYLARRQGGEIMQLRVPVPWEWDDLVSELRYMPTEAHAGALARRLADAEWVQGEPRAPRAPSPEAAQGPVPLPAVPWVRDLDSTRRYGDRGEPIDFSLVIVEAWSYTFDNTSGRVTARKIVEVMEPRGRGEEYAHHGDGPGHP